MFDIVFAGHIHSLTTTKEGKPVVRVLPDKDLSVVPQGEEPEPLSFVCEAKQIPQGLSLGDRVEGTALGIYSANPWKEKDRFNRETGKIKYIKNFKVHLLTMQREKAAKSA